MPNKMGTAFDDKILKSPLTVARPKKEPGPAVNNSPVMAPDDPLKFIPSNSKKMGKLGND
jgi:hypothetical protein